MINFFEAYPSYVETLTREQSLPRLNLSDVKGTRNLYKEVVGRVFWKFAQKNGILDIASEKTMKQWCWIANKSVLFHDTSHMLECIMVEMRSSSPKISLKMRNRRADSKADLQYICFLARKEAKKIRNLYNDVACYDPEVDSQFEYYKLRKALLFLKIAIGCCLYSKLPTTLSESEYDKLVELSGRPEVAEERYRYNVDRKEYNRVGGMRRKSAYLLFGIEGCEVFIERAINRYEVILRALHH